MRLMRWLVCGGLLGAVALFAGGEKKTPPLAGTWSGDGFEIVLNADGTGTLRDSDWSPAEPIGWQAAGGRISISQDGETTDYEYLLQGGLLRVSGGDLDEPISLRRAAAGSAPAPASAAGSPPASPAKKKPAPPPPAAPKPGSCPTSCAHYLQCAGGADANTRAECVTECRAAGYQPDFLGWFETTDCATALAVVAYLDEQQRGMSGGSGGGQGNQSSECQGCVWDGSECNWYSQSNWGSQSAYSGAVITCNRSCCGR